MNLKLICGGLLLACMTACATSPTGRSQLILVSDSEINQMGVQSFDQLRQQGKFADAPKERAYATCVADSLIRVLPAPWNSEHWEVQIIKDDTPNAFALPGGRIGVNQGMFKVATDASQLAVVLGHELSHVIARHGAERVSDNMATQLGVTAASIAGAARGIDPNTTQSLLGLGSQVGILLPFSRTQESEADTLGQRYMAAAGYDPHAAVTLWQKMQRDAGGGQNSFLSTHPSPGQRIERLSQGANALMPVYEQARRESRHPNCKL